MHVTDLTAIIPLNASQPLTSLHTLPTPPSMQLSLSIQPSFSTQLALPADAPSSSYPVPPDTGALCYISQLLLIFTEQCTMEIAKQISLQEAEQQKAALKHRLELSVTGYIFYEDGCNPIITRMQNVPTQFVLQANVRLDFGLSEDGLFHLYDKLIGAWIKIKEDHIMTVSPGAHLFFKTLDCEIPFYFDDYLDQANYDNDSHL
ncbi:hypothetical protein ARMGADRAFT_1081507 [Armillaria gallica]|uniref:Uncharacterized protein n=1 Tax=Armillaria gallica TaxID=47427 RepID=A0A2H3DKD4_ARMGA|nr:hypothetical protein ARMGADRAFT_1081507 [Armillaria gallica]